MPLDKLLKVRTSQIKRILYELGNYGIFAVLFTILLLAFSCYLYSLQPYSLLTSILVLSVVLYIHTNRIDLDFLSSKFENDYKILVAEYGLLCSPFLLLATIFLRFDSLLMIIFGIFIIPFIRIKIKFVVGHFITRYIPNEYYEWKSGVRKTKFLPFVFILAAYCSCGFYVLPLAFLWLTSIMIATFYDENESLEVLMHNSKIKNIFQYKILRSIKLVSIIYLPVLIVNCILIKESVLINLMFYFSQMIFILFVLVFKFKNYIPNYNVIKNSNFVASIGIASAIPYLSMIPLFFIIIYYRKALDNVNNFIQ
jgi:hypothetical protein